MSFPDYFFLRYT